MNKLKPVHHRAFGTHNFDWINIIACLLVILYNTIDYFIKGVDLNTTLTNIIPFILYPAIYIFFRNKTTTSILYFVVGIMTIVFDKYECGASGLIYIYFCYNELRSNKFNIIIVISSYVALSMRLILLQSHGSESIMAIILFTFIFATLYFKVIKDNSMISKLPEEIKAILKQYCNGYTYEQISFNLGLGVTPGTIRRKITAFMNKNDIKNDAQLGKWLHRNV